MYSVNLLPEYGIFPHLLPFDDVQSLVLLQIPQAKIYVPRLGFQRSSQYYFVRLIYCQPVEPHIISKRMTKRSSIFLSQSILDLFCLFLGRMELLLLFVLQASFLS